LHAKLANLSPRLANVCSPLFFLKRLPREFCLIGRLGVAFHIAQAGVATDRSNLMRRASCLGQAPAGRLAQSVGGALFG